jgi:glycosyltransferase involved in cell wall biosynthesis
LVYIPSGIDLSRFGPATVGERESYRKKWNLPRDAFIFVNVANWNPKVKGQLLLLDAFKVFLEKTNCDRCLLLMVGFGTDSEIAKREIFKRNLTSKVIGLGFQKEVPQILKMSDVGVSASFIEGLGNSILQYMASKLLVISTETVGVSSYLKDGFNGLAVPVGDKYRLAGAMEKALRMDERERLLITENAFRTAQSFSIENTAKKYLGLFEELAG